MWPRSGIKAFVFRLLLFYGLLLIPWPGLNDAYAAVFRGAGNGLFASFGAHRAVRFKPVSEKPSKWDTDVYLIQRGTSKAWTINHNSRYTGYLPVAALLALVFATPVPWSRRWRALLVGLVLVNAFVVLRVAISLVYGFRGLELFIFSPFWNRTLDLAYEAISVSVVAIFLVPAVIWILVTVRREDWATLFETTGKHPPSSASASPPPRNG